MKLCFIFSCLFLIISCSGKKHLPEAIYKTEEFNAIMDTTGAVPDKSNNDGIKFSDYSTGANKLNSKALSFQRLNFVVIEFETEQLAKSEALRLNQYYSRNWLFDKVEGEPILEDLVLVKFHGQNPKRRLQRKPVNKFPVHDTKAGAAGGSSH
jgi:hypothetical protein